MDSILAKWYQSDSDGVNFCERVWSRIENGDNPSVQVQTPEIGHRQAAVSTDSRRTYALEATMLAASLLIGLSAYFVLVGLEQPTHPVASSESSAAASAETSNQAELENAKQETISQEAPKIKYITRIDDRPETKNNETDFKRHADTNNHFDQKIVSKGKPETSPNVKQNPGQSSYFADLPGSRSSVAPPTNQAVFGQHKLVYPPQRSLEFEIEINRSGYGNIAVNGKLVAKRLLPAEIGKIFEAIEPEIVDRIAILGPRIGPVTGTIYVQAEGNGESFEFRSIKEFRESVAIVRKEIPLVKTKYRKGRSLDENVIASTLFDTTREFQYWAKESLQAGFEPLPYRDPAEKFRRIIDLEDFREFARTGKFTVPGPESYYVDATVIQPNGPSKLRRSLIVESKPVSLFKHAGDFREFRMTMAAQSRKDNIEKPIQPLAQIIGARPDLQGLPLVMGDECHLNSERGNVLNQISRSIGPVLSRFDAFSSRNTKTHPQYRKRLMETMINQVKTKLPQSANSAQEMLTIDQMLQIEQPELRLELVRMLGDSKSRVGCNLLSCYVKYDMNPEVRMAATQALSKMPRDVYREKLLEGLQYPWLEAAKHAAEALVRLNDVKAVPHLVELLNKPDPREPFQNSNGQYVKRELVSINHLKNCLLCHADSQSISDFGRAPVPEWNKALPRQYYNSHSSSLAARADVTYLRQDFSVVQSVEDHGSWPEQQRFDYVIREAPMSSDQVEEHSKANPTFQSREYRSVIVFALQMLTDKNPLDNSYQSWKEISEQLKTAP